MDVPCLSPGPCQLGVLREFLFHNDEGRGLSVRAPQTDPGSTGATDSRDFTSVCVSGRTEVSGTTVIYSDRSESTPLCLFRGVGLVSSFSTDTLLCSGMS